jgi:hypothetical protein
VPVSWRLASAGVKDREQADSCSLRDPCRKDPLRNFQFNFLRLTEKSNCDPQKLSLRKSRGQNVLKALSSCGPARRAKRHKGSLRSASKDGGNIGTTA